VNCEMESGKSRVLKNVAAMGFNGMFFISMTMASLFRLIESHRPTVCIDEAETLSKDDKGSLVTIYNAGYQAGVSVPRVEGDSGARRVEGYDVYAPLAVGGIAGVGRVAASRSVTSTMLRSTNRATVNRELKPEDPSFAPIRAGLHRMGMVRHQEFTEPNRTFPTSCWAARTSVFCLCSRLAMLAGQEITDDVLRVAKRCVLSYDGISKELSALMNVLEDRLDYHDAITVYPGGDDGLNVEMALHLGMNVERGERLDDAAVGKMLRRVGFEPLKRTKRGIPYLVTRAAFADVAKRNGYPFEGFEPVKPIPIGDGVEV
jgi:hypothetical protein